MRSLPLISFDVNGAAIKQMPSARSLGPDEVLFPRKARQIACGARFTMVLTGKKHFEVGSKGLWLTYADARRYAILGICLQRMASSTLLEMVVMEPWELIQLLVRTDVCWSASRIDDASASHIVPTL